MDTRLGVIQDDATSAARLFADAISARDIDAALAICDPAIEFSSMLAHVEGTLYRGHDGVRRYFADVAAAWDEWQIETERVVPVPDGRAVIVLCMHIRGKASGVPLDERVAHVWEARDGKLWRSTPYREVEDAFRAVGLTEPPDPR